MRPVWVLPGSFLFFNNYVREYPMAEQKNVRISVKLPSQTLTFPRKPFDVATGSYFIWPFNLEMSGVRLKYATAQLLCKLERNHETYYFFFPQNGIAPEFAFDATTVRDAQSPGGKIEEPTETYRIRPDARPGNRCVRHRNGRPQSELRFTIARTSAKRMESPPRWRRSAHAFRPPIFVRRH